jgi:hypothetical protein
MGRKATTPPDGAEVLYSRFVVEWRGGRVRIEAASGLHVQRGSVMLSDAVDLQLQLGVAIAQARAASVESFAARDAVVD